MRTRRRGNTLVVALVLAAVAIACATVLVVHLARHRHYHEPELPAEWAARTNPREDDQDARVRGRKLFTAKGCTLCHGPHADGRGSAAKGMTPAPANFTGTDLLQKHSDAWLFWRISEGKRGTAMPSWSGSLSEDQRWDLVSYLRSLENR